MVLSISPSDFTNILELLVLTPYSDRGRQLLIFKGSTPPPRQWIGRGKGDLAVETLRRIYGTCLLLSLSREYYYLGAVTEFGSPRANNRLFAACQYMRNMMPKILDRAICMNRSLQVVQTKNLPTRNYAWLRTEPYHVLVHEESDAVSTICLSHIAKPVKQVALEKTAQLTPVIGPTLLSSSDHVHS